MSIRPRKRPGTSYERMEVARLRREKVAIEQRVAELTQERDELKYRLQAWDDSLAEKLADLEREAEGLRRECSLDTIRLDWLETEMDRENEAMSENQLLPDSLFRRNIPITRKLIDAARDPQTDTGGSRSTRDVEAEGGKKDA